MREYKFSLRSTVGKVKFKDYETIELNVKGKREDVLELIADSSLKMLIKVGGNE